MVNHPNRPKRTRKVSMAPDVVVPPPPHDHDADYAALLRGVQRTFDRMTAPPGTKLFLTNAIGLWDAYLSRLSADVQVHNCHACRSFINHYGALAVISPLGVVHSAIWDSDDVPEFYGPAVTMLKVLVERSRVLSTWVTKQPVWGQPQTGAWSHLAVDPPGHLLYKASALSPSQVMAAAKENHKTVLRALSEFSIPQLDQGLRLLKAEALVRSEKFVGPMQWLRDLQDRPKGPRGENMVWRAIASAPEGYCHPRASVIGPLLDDIEAGLPYEEIRRKFAAMLGPLQYQRPQVAPSRGNIFAAEKLVEKLGIAPSLERRYARLEDLKPIWVPHVNAVAPTEGVFGHLKAKGEHAAAALDLPGQAMTWVKFADRVLPDAEKIEIAVPFRGQFIALTTAVHPDAPPILKWDREDERNPLAWYVYPNGSPASQWGLRDGWAPLTAVQEFPTMMGSRPMPYIAEGVILVIRGAVDSKHSSNALFPECLREELFGARATIEAYSKTAPLHDRDMASACGYDIRKAMAACDLRVLINGGWQRYQIDRWD